MDEQMLRAIADEWSNSIQFTPIQPSLGSGESLLPTMVETFLRDPVPFARRFRDRQDAARLMTKSVRDAVARRIGPTRSASLVSENVTVGGHVVRRSK